MEEQTESERCRNLWEVNRVENFSQSKSAYEVFEHFLYCILKSETVLVACV